jgi:hypothetical protein
MYIKVCVVCIVHVKHPVTCCMPTEHTRTSNELQTELNRMRNKAAAIRGELRALESEYNTQKKEKDGQIGAIEKTD